MKKRILIVAAVLISSQLQAQQDSSKTLDEVIFTANKFPQKQSNTGKVVTVITKEQLDRSPAKTVAQLLNDQAGIVVNGSLNNAGSVQTIYMRGASSGRTLILIDGVPVNDPSMINNEYDLNLFALSDVDRIEICKGAQSTLYGSDAVAGVINIITVTADVKKAFNVRSTISGGKFGTGKANVQLYGKKDKLTYTVRYAKMLTSGFSSAYDSTGKNGYDKDQYDANVANAQLQWQATKELAFRTFVMYSQYKADIDQGVFSDEKDFTINNDAINTGTGFTFKREYVTLTGNYQYSQLNRKYLNDSVMKEPGAFNTFERNNYFGKTQYAEIYANIALGGGFDLVQGADYRFASFNQDYYSESMFGPYESHFRDTSLSQTSIYKEFGKQAIMSDLLYFKYYFLDTLKIPYDKEKLIDDFEGLSTYLSRVDNKYFMFRDFQSRNIMVKDNEVHFIDYQGGMKGAIQYDVASLLWQAKAELSEEWKTSLLQYYMTCVEEILQKPLDKNRFESQYNGYVLIRLLQVLGAYGFRGLFERKAHFLTSIPLAIKNIKWFIGNKQVGVSLPEFERLLHLMTADEIMLRFEPNKATAETALLVKVNSFSYLKTGYPKDETINGGGFVFDCRGILNPGRIDEFKQQTGRDKPVKDFLEQQTKMPEFLNNVYNIVDIAVEDYMKRGFESLMINFGCTGGQHRSVYAADAVVRHLRNKFGVKVELNHIEQNIHEVKN